jgi:hypothetical protein
MLNLGPLRIAVAMMVIFVVSFGIMWRQRKNQDLDIPVPQATPITEDARAPLPAASSTSLPVKETQNPVTPIATQRFQPVANSASLNEGAARQPLPVSIHIWNRENKHKIEGAVQSLSGSELIVTARVESDASHEVSEFQLVVEPGQTQTFSTENGLQLHSHDQITFQCPPYEDQIQIVP